MRKILYVGVKLTDESKKLLDDYIPAVSEKKYLDHMTSEFRPQEDSDILQWVLAHEGETIELKVSHYGFDVSERGNVWALGVKTEAPSKNKRKHITIATSGTRKPVESNHITEWYPIDGPVLEGVVCVWEES